MPSSKGKGKGSARSDREDDERTPLLEGEPSTTDAPAVVRHGRGLLSEDDDEDGDGDVTVTNRRSVAAANGGPDIDANESIFTLRRPIRFRRPSVGALCCYFFLVLIGILFIAFAIIHTWLGRFVSEQLQHDGQLLRDRGADAMVWRGPDKVKILDIQGERGTVQIDMRAGIDVRTVFGWNDTQAAAITAGKPRKLPLTRKMERSIVGWATRRIGQASMDLPQPVLVAPKDAKHYNMLQVALEGAITLPLHFPKTKDYDPTDLAWLRPITIVVPVEALDSRTLATFINNTMESRKGEVHVTVQKANVALGRQDDRGWLARVVQRYGGQSVENLENDVAFDVPASPDLPKDPGSMVKLRSYSLVAIPTNTSEHDGGRKGRHGDRHNSTEPDHSSEELLGIHATARIENLGYEQLHKLSLDLNIPFAWPYKVYIASVSNKTEFVTLATGVVEPFTIPSDVPHFDVSVNGTVERTGNSSTPLSQSLSKFITRYMAGKNNTVHVAFDPSSPYAKALPAFLIPFLENRVVSNEVPGLPAEDRDLLKDLKIDKMRIHPAENGGSGFECDGQIQGELVMPKAMDQLQGGLNITSIWPDIILYDGLPPAGTDEAMPPVPLPANAFARFKPTDWVPADTFIDKATNATVMRAMVTNVPLDILNRGVLQRWLAKIIFSGGNGVRTGIKGLTQARATVRGFGEVELHKLPVLGVFLANKPAMLEAKPEEESWVERVWGWLG